MSQNRKYLGMTSAQIGILIGLGAAACILFAITGWFMFGGNISLPFSKAPENTPTPQSTPTLIVLPTINPTATLTPIPYEQLIPAGWKQFKTALIEIWLPDGFKSVKPSEVENLEQGSAIVELALQSKSGTPLYRNLAIVLYQPIDTDSLDTFLDRELPKMSTDVVITNRRKTSLNSVDVTVITMESRISNVVVDSLVYVFLDGGTVWYVEYAAEISEYFDMLPIFEQSAKTFRVVK